MQILSVTLKNFKSHSDRHYSFQPGTNAICGENGAGKTSILEAIAWTLFNHKGAYRVEDLIRNGAGSAQARVAFISRRDGRTYEVERCTTKGYLLYDPQLAVRLEYRHIEQEVMPWMRQHLGVAPGTDLARLFANTIGVPQGTFTADFLKAPEDRKKVFDAILKVEEYKQANQSMLSLEKYAKAESENLERDLARYDEALQQLEPLQQRQQSLRQEMATAEAQLVQLQATLAQLQAEKEQLAGQAQQVQQLSTQRQTLTTQCEAKQQAIALLQQTTERCRQAVQLCDAHQLGYQTYLQAEATLQQLEAQGQQRGALAKQRDAQQTSRSEAERTLTRLTLQLETLTKAADELTRLQPLVVQQTELDQQQAAIATQLQQFHTWRLEQQSVGRQLAKSQSVLETLTRDIQRIKGLADTVAQLPNLEQRRDRLQEQLTRIAAAQQFEVDLRQMLEAGEDKRDRHLEQSQSALKLLQTIQQKDPSLIAAPIDAAVLAIQLGIDLNDEMLDALEHILTDLAEQTSTPKLKQQLKDVKTQIDGAYKQQAEFATLEAKLTQQEQFQAEIAHAQAQIDQHQAHLTAETAVQEQRSQLSAQLAALGDPRSRSQLLQRDLAEQPTLQATYATAQAAQATIQQEIAHLDAQLEPFAELDLQTATQRQQRQLHQASYLTVVEHQKEAAQLPTLEAEGMEAIAQLQGLETDRQTVEVAYQALLQTYDPQRWQQVEADYTTTRSQADQLAGGLPQQRKLLAELNTQLAALNQVAEKRDRAQTELKQREKNRRFVSFARKAYKEAGPRITERYVLTVSREADRLFRELMNRPNVSLQWTRDYELLVQEGAHPRRFINLSGGEQMCAALAVRLALLRTLADIDVAFFDEPTTNMDRPRRESLAEAIANIKTFRQIFVISHDDTFEKVTENVILVQREV